MPKYTIAILIVLFKFTQIFRNISHRLHRFAELKICIYLENPLIASLLDDVTAHLLQNGPTAA